MDAWDAAREDIKSRLSIEDVVGRQVDLKRSGASLKGLCPFHQEKTPSFYVSPQRGTFHCFGCGKGGDIFTFLMETEHLSFPDAQRRLAEQAGVALPQRNAEKPSLRGSLYEANDAAARFFRRALDEPDGRRAREYLFSRGFGQDAVDLFDLGYAPSGGGVVKHLLEGGIDQRVVLAAGLAIEDSIGGGLRDRFRGRLMFPIRDGSGRVSGFGGRVLGEGLPKYLNSPQTEIFDKSSVLFGVHRAQDAIRQAGRAVLVEGYLDAVRAHLGGYVNTVASLGTAVTAQQLKTLARLTSTVILALDPDPAGQSAATRTSLTALMEITRERGRAPGASGTVDLRIAQLPPDTGDPDELIRDRREAWERALDESVAAFEFYFVRTMDALDRTSESWRQEAIDHLLPLIQQLSGSPGWQATWIQRLATETGIDARAIQRAMPAGQERRRRAPRESANDVVSRTTARGLTVDLSSEVEQGLVALLLQVLVVPDQAAEALAGIELDRPEHRHILEQALRWQNYDYELFRDALPEEVREVADELRRRGAPLPPDGKLSVAVRLHLVRLQQARLQTQLNRATQLLQSMSPQDQVDASANIASLTAEKGQIDQELRRLQQLAMQTHHGTIDQESGSS